MGNVDKWSALAELMETHSDGTWIFRGVTNCGHQLIPKIGRPEWRHDGITENVRAFDTNEERRLLEDFKKRARPYITYQPKTDIEWLAIGQHHGLPTRLLDWTESLLVAAYFAVENAGVGGPPAIYAYKPACLMDEQIPLFEQKTVSLYKPPHISPRIPAQRAVFTFSVDPTVSLNSKDIKKWCISKQACFQIKRTLDATGINRASIYPDLDGLCAGLAWRYKWGF